MKDTPWKRDEIASPCVNICLMHPDAKICTGCLRTLAEITRWSHMPADERQAILAALPDRAGQLKKRRGGRAARQAR